MEELKKKGHNIDIKGLAIHRITKSANVQRATLHLSNKTIVVKDNEKRFISDLHSAYYKKSSPHYGIFAGERPAFKNQLIQYYNSKIDFLKFTQNSSEIFKKTIETSSPATGGFLIFAHYVNTDSNIAYMLVLTTNNKNGFSINEEKLTIEDIKTLDMSKIDVACLINLTKWKTVGDNDEDTYLSFVKGNKDISLYFMNFIDCDNKTSSKMSSRKLLGAIEAYMNENNWDIDKKQQVKNTIYSYCDTCISNKEGISLSVISQMINSENPDEFQEFAQAEERGVSAIISGDKNELKRLRSIYYRNEDYIISFKREMLNKKIVYDKSKKTLTFKDIPQELIDQLN